MVLFKCFSERTSFARPAFVVRSGISFEYLRAAAVRRAIASRCPIPTTWPMLLRFSSCVSHALVWKEALRCWRLESSMMKVSRRLTACQGHDPTCPHTLPVCRAISTPSASRAALADRADQGRRRSGGNDGGGRRLGSERTLPIERNGVPGVDEYF